MGLKCRVNVITMNVSEAHRFESSSGQRQFLSRFLSEEDGWELERKSQSFSDDQLHVIHRHGLDHRRFRKFFDTTSIRSQKVKIASSLVVSCF